MSPHNTQKNNFSQPLSGIFPIEKQRGETLAEMLTRFRTTHHLDMDAKLTYAGRLDPMAEGLVIVLAGDARFQKDKMLGLGKEYEMEILLGISTDSQDTLGLIDRNDFKNVEQSLINDVVGQIRDIKSLSYPIYSSRPVNGKPLFSYARAGEEVELPEKKVKISEVEIINIREESLKAFEEVILSDIDKVTGDFRQEQIKSSWKELIAKNPVAKITFVKIRAKVSSGTYMRSLAKWVGDKIGIPTLAYSITRLIVGEYKI